MQPVKLFHFVVTVTIVVALLGLLGSAPAIAQPVFNPHYILSDAELEDYQSMDEEAIRSFLLSQGSTLAEMQAVDASGTARYVSEIIFNASQDYRISPKYTLATLQKEQSLIEDRAPTQRQYDWALGYGVCDGCSTADPALQKYRGLGKQIDYAVGTQRVYLDDSVNRPWLYQVGRTYLIDGTSVTMTNRATAAFYNYTPHLHGNQLFFRLWNRYFHQLYPDGSLLKASTSPDVWLIEGGFRRRFSTWTSLITRFNPALIITVEPSIIGNFEVGRELKFSQYALLQNTSTQNIYLYANDRLRLIDPETFRILGFNPDEVEAVEAVELASIPPGDNVSLSAAYPLGALVKVEGKPELYIVQDSVAHLLVDKELVKLLFPEKKQRLVTASKFRTYELGDPIQLPEGTLVRTPAEPAVYVISHRQRRPIVSGEAFEALGYRWANVLTLGQAIVDVHPLGQEVTVVVPLVPEAPVYIPPALPTPRRPTPLPLFPPLPTDR